MDASAKNELVTIDLTKLEELSELSGLLNYDYTKTKFNVVSCDVTLENLSDWKGIFTINKGSEAGIEKGDVVINGVGLVGKICEVGSGWAKVKPVIAEENNIRVEYVTGEGGLIGALAAIGLYNKPEEYAKVYYEE